MSEQRKKSGLSVRAVVATGIGAAIFLHFDEVYCDSNRCS